MRCYRNGVGKKMAISKRILLSGMAGALLISPWIPSTSIAMDVNSQSFESGCRNAEMILNDFSPAVEYDGSVDQFDDSILTEENLEGQQESERSGRAFGIPLKNGVTKRYKVSTDLGYVPFTVSISSSTVAQFDVALSAPGGSVDVYIENFKGVDQFLGTVWSATHLRSYPVSVPAGNYTLKLYFHLSNPGLMNIGYITVPGMDAYSRTHVYEYEDNNVTAHANALYGRSSCLGFMYDLGAAYTSHAHVDTDFFSFELAEDAYTRIKYAAKPGVHVALVDASGNTLRYNLNSDENLLQATVPYGQGDTPSGFFDCGLLKAGKYFIKVWNDQPSNVKSLYMAEYELRDTQYMDVQNNTPHKDDIMWLTNTGISKGWREWNGYSFRPISDVARADMAAFLYRLVGSPMYVPSAEEKARFVDVDDNTPHAKEIWWLASTGITTGWDMGDRQEFRPYASVARADMAAFLYRLAGSPEYKPSESELKAFRDVNNETSHANEVYWLASAGISKGWTEGDGSHTFRPYWTVARADMAAFLHRMSNIGLLPSE